MPERAKSVRIPARWRRMFDTMRVEQGLTVTQLARQAEVDRKTASGIISGRLKKIRPETVRNLVKGLGLREEFRQLDLLVPFGIQLPFRGFHSIMWQGRLGSVGHLVNQIMVEEGLVELTQQQRFGDVLLPQVVVSAHAVRDLGQPNAGV